MILPLVLLFSFLASSTAQRLTFDLLAFPSISKGYVPNVVIPYSGVCLSLIHGKNSNFETGISFRSLPWGSEVALSEGYRIDLLSRSRYLLNSTSKVFIGLPLFYNKLSLSSALSTEVNLKFKNFERVILNGGFRVNANAFYKTTSKRYIFSEAVLGLRINLWK